MSSNITSKPIESNKPVEGVQFPRSGHAMPMAGVLIGLALWPIGARYTIDGILWIANFILTFVRVPYQIPLPPVWQMYLLLAPICLICSGVEWRAPLFKRAGRWEFASADTIIIWLVIVVLDVGTTYAGIRNPGRDAWPIMQELAASLVLSGILSAILTFGPEWLMREGWRKLWR